MNLKKFFLYLLISSVALSAVVGIGVILFGSFGELERRILLTTLTITVTSILGLACGVYLETGRGRVLPVGGIVLACLSAILWIVLVWSNTIQNQIFVKTLMSATLLAAVCAHLSLILMARLDRRFLWSRYTAQLAVWILTGLLMSLIWTNFKATSDFLGRMIAVLSILIAALTVVTPVFHRLSNQAPDAKEIDAEIARLRARIEELEKQRAEMTNNEN